MKIREAVVFLISTVILLCYFYSFILDEISRGQLDIKKAEYVALCIEDITPLLEPRLSSKDQSNKITHKNVANGTTADTQTMTDETNFVALSRNLQRITEGHKITTAKDIFEYCPFEPLDPWRKELAEHIHDKHGFKNCTVREELRPKTKLLNGTISVSGTSGLVCKGRCLWYVNEHSTKFGEWENISYKFPCDFVETACSMNQFNEAYSTRFVHKQIVEQRNKSEKKLNLEEHPDLHIIILDSVGSSHFIRATPLYARKSAIVEIRAVRDQARVTIEEVERIVMNLPQMNADLSKKEHCETFLDDHEFIPFEYKRKGYKTIMVEDYSEGILTYKACLGMKAEPHHHTYRVFENKRREDEELQKILWEGLYVPKFSMSWMVDLAHDDAGNLYSNDYDIYTFLKKHRKTLKNSFFFFYGDHGCKFGEECEVAGRSEVSNPFLYIVIPERYRQSPIYKQLLKNSKELVTPHDLHSTFKDILYFQPQYNFTDISFKNFTSNPRGFSLLRQFQANKSRNCKTLPIPYNYCLCQYGRKPVRDILEDHGNVTLNQMFGQPAIERLNKILSFHSSECHPLVLKNVTKVELFVLPNNESVKFEANAYDVTFAVSGPVEAIFKVPFRVEGDVVILGSNTFTRIDVDEVVTAEETWNCKNRAIAGKSLEENDKQPFSYWILLLSAQPSPCDFEYRLLVFVMIWKSIVL
ncbi:unnamed protein product [Cylicocyclus nassatus]|uniref:Uncharacterized protein n=1 Tax=Cylicocyclus nassatus TaxID=53992 RepID=A0AA36GHB3_CYLNA|nr:unnamed protein product [Cylicocyclus nassatus]